MQVSGHPPSANAARNSHAVTGQACARTSGMVNRASAQALEMATVTRPKAVRVSASSPNARTCVVMDLPRKTVPGMVKASVMVSVCKADLAMVKVPAPRCVMVNGLRVVRATASLSNGRTCAVMDLPRKAVPETVRASARRTAMASVRKMVRAMVSVRRADLVMAKVPARRCAMAVSVHKVATGNLMVPGRNAVRKVTARRVSAKAMAIARHVRRWRMSNLQA